MKKDMFDRKRPALMLLGFTILNSLFSISSPAQPGTLFDPGMFNHTPAAASSSSLPSGCVLWLTMDDLTGNDSSGGGNTATLVGSPTNATGHITNAIGFNGTSQRMSVPSAVVSSGNVTLCCWVYYTGTAEGDPIAIGGSSSTNQLLYMSVNPSGDNKFSLGQLVTGSWYQGVSSTVAIPKSTWTHLAIAYNGTTKGETNYVNGAYDSSGTMTYGWPSALTQTEIGADYANSGWLNWWAGLLDDVMVFNRCLTAAEVNTLFNANY